MRRQLFKGNCCRLDNSPHRGFVQQVVGVGTAKVGTAKVGTAKVGTAKVGTAKVGTAKVAAPAVC
jgi:hypothetical protein